MSNFRQPPLRFDLLWKAIQADDQQAFRRLYETQVDMMYNYGRKMCSHAPLVEDAIQDVFRILWEKKSSLDIEHSLKAYLLTMLRREIMRKLQQEKAKYALLPSSELPFELSIESSIILEEAHQERRRSLEASLQALTPRQREILFLRYQENLSFDEISQLMTLNHNSMYKLLAAAIKRLRQQLLALVLTFFPLFLSLLKAPSSSC